MLMEPTHYLPSEELKDSNYPEISRFQGELNAIESYFEEVSLALAWYEDDIFDKIDVNPVDLTNYINRCRSVCEQLAKAPKICFEVLLDVREMQGVLQELLYLKRMYGDTYVGTPTDVSERHEGGEI